MTDHMMNQMLEMENWGFQNEGAEWWDGFAISFSRLIQPTTNNVRGGHRHMRIHTRAQEAALRAEVPQQDMEQQAPPPTQKQVNYLIWMVLKDLRRMLDEGNTRTRIRRIIADLQPQFTMANGFVQCTDEEREAEIAGILERLLEQDLDLVVHGGEEPF